MGLCLLAILWLFPKNGQNWGEERFKNCPTISRSKGQTLWCIQVNYPFNTHIMALAIYALLIALNLISSPAEFDQLPPEQQQEMLVIITDVEM